MGARTRTAVSIATLASVVVVFGGLPALRGQLAELRTTTFAASGPARPGTAMASADTPDVATAAIPVRVDVAKLTASAGEIRTSGTLLFKREITLGFKVPGIVRSFAVDAGDTASAGTLLAMLDPTEVGARTRDAQAALDNAEAAMKRQRALFDKGFVSQAALDNAQMAVERAKASRDAAGFDAAKSELHAPGDGVVLSRLAETNEVVAAGKPILLYGDASGGLVLVTPVSDTQITRLRGGDTATIRFAGVSATIKAIVSRLAAKADARTGAFDVELKLSEFTPGLRSGLVGDARIQPSVAGEQSNYPAIPAAALLEGRGDRAAVFIVDAQGHAQRRNVRIAGFIDDLVLIAEGLAVGDRVVTSGAAYLRNGQAVKIVSDAPPSS